jgi:hypothetical protein
MRLAIVIFVIGVTAVASDDTAQLAGSWTGESICTGVNPSCRDEKSIYTFSSPDASGLVTWQADKVVNGQRITMGTMKLSYDQEHSTLHGENAAGVWHFIIKGTAMDGTLKLRSGETARNIRLKKDS